MIARVSAFMLALSTLFMASCDRRATAPPSDAKAEASPVAIADSPTPSSRQAPVPEPPSIIEAGPEAPDSGVSREARERAVLALLAGGEGATRLPHVATDPGHVFDPSQRDRVAPPPRPPSVKAGNVTVTGGLSAVVIERITRQSFGRFRLCYENGLRTNPALLGRVVVHFVIDKTGSVESSRSEGSSFADANVVQCIVRGFSNLSYPEPEKGVVQVSYEVLLDPGT
jgi:hypothetical protein